MKKNILNKFLLCIFTFLILSNSLYAKKISEKINLNDIEILIDSEIKTKEDYEEKQDLLNPVVQKYEKADIKKEDDLKLDGSVGVNKEAKSIDEVKINIGTNF